jgi:hypothetical protein
MVNYLLHIEVSILLIQKVRIIRAQILIIIETNRPTTGVSLAILSAMSKEILKFLQSEENQL